jgi:hypothetical protein
MLSATIPRVIRGRQIEMIVSLSSMERTGVSRLHLVHYSLTLHRDVYVTLFQQYNVKHAAYPTVLFSFIRFQWRSVLTSTISEELKLQYTKHKKSILRGMQDKICKKKGSTVLIEFANSIIPIEIRYLSDIES